ncbi:heparin-binding hemagglutinin [Nocardia huaxiensis]|uniref:Heparin-binding hemagglutinin n=1 Tax=Nocardia huaxiensis TaxID=2755382 RepID=A0A7D6ZCL2_9NOCA|nr:heparin-binding hemagglutinin [Nocardia huaxiensis]QLY32228.1 heparin-binding hemagglutinin [Nocardia huaxiensis]UFS94066.1 heparin-binding hemagglutinin [Nocardia huaxiensis]
MTEPKITTATVTKPIYATVGAGDAIYTAVLDAVSQIRERAAASDVTGRVEEARERLANLPADVQEQVEVLRQRVAALPSELPEDLAELREKATPEELRRLVDQYYHQLLDLYADLAARGEETVEKLRANPTFEGRYEQVESVVNDLVAQTQDVIGKVSDQVAPLLGRVKEDAVAVEETVEAEVVGVTTESEPAAPAPAAKKAAPAKKAPAKKAPAKKAAPAAKK